MLPHSGRVPPALPARSPLRPRPLPLSPPPESVDADNDPELDTGHMTFSSLNAVISSVVDAQREKPLPEPVAELEQPREVSSSLPLTKRQHALHELLSSERAYASDLALIREVHIPLALGHTVPLPNLPITPPNSSGSSSRTLSTASDSSLTSLGPPMTPEDVKLVFGNISEIAVFSDLFCQALEEALGALLDGGKGDDHVGALFLSIVSELERPYKQYITRHATALTHLQQLPQTPAIQNYLLHTQSIAASLSHAWDLSSLLIKPVQRLLKYPLLLAAIIDETPDNHPDKQNLREARKQMEEVARNVNEGRRRVEVVRDVLTSKKKGPVSVTVSASVNLTKMKSLRVSGPSTKTPNGSPSDKVPDEAILVERLEKELKEVEEFSQKFAKNVVEWARMTSNVVGSLRAWALGFAKVIGLSADQGSEAFDAFLTVVEHELMPLCVDLEALINERVLKELAHLLMTMTQPLKLLASMNEQEPYHYHLMNMNVSAKNRPPPALLAASTNYLALRGQLAAELPTYMSLLHRGLKVFIHRLSAIQMEFYSKVRDKWVYLWEMLRLEEELNVGAEETVNVWFGRWCEVNEMLGSVSILQDRGLHHRHRRESRTKSQDQDRERERDRELEDPEADAEYYTYHHLQAFAHHHSPPVPDHTHPRLQPPSHNHGHGPGSPSSPPSTEPPNSPNSFATSFTSSLSGGQSTERRIRDKASERYYEHKDPPKKKAVAQAQAANVKSMFGALEPLTYVSAAGFVATTAPPLSSPRPGATGSGTGSGGGMSSPKADSPNSTRARGNSDVSSYGSPPMALLSGVGLGLGGTGVFSSPMSGGGGWKKKNVSKKGSNESLKSKATAVAVARSPQIASASVSTSTSATIVAQQPAASDRGQGQGTGRPPYPPRNSAPHPQRRRTTAGIEPAPEDLREYEIMMMREQERMREKEREREFGHASRSGGGGGHHHGNNANAGAGGRGNGTVNGSGSGSGHAHPHSYTHQYGHGLPRTKSMPLPYHPQSQPRAQGQRQEQDASRRVAGEWSEYADEEDSELFYQPSPQRDQYEREETEYRTARPRERERKDPPGGGSGSGRRQTPHSHSQSAHGRQQSVGKDEERRRHSAHSTYSTKSRDDKRERDKDKDPSSRKRSGSIKSITSFFTSNRDSHDYSSATTAQSTLDHTQSTSPRDSWALKPSKYTCQVIHPCKPPTTGSVPLSYFSFPFFTLKESEYYDVLQEAGHPSLHPNLPLIVDEGEDCLLLCRAWDGSIGWALASFLEPVGSVEG
ncbi:hypothetical protein P691DRAFT_763777 [Macrolepiota fuliginosa MF-IS2]|uniref:DH domain-containing protein n=1 Tax=Macrolepiota fuliginosa MF-IS2 TaxID=1400762 RepID=A0A9P6BXG6_9AGAR|nr:hypothetical protein P691DRAFT_763777 [Macrolepiota fuliginosa MF-IS2]